MTHRTLSRFIIFDHPIRLGGIPDGISLTILIKEDQGDVEVPPFSRARK